MQVEVDVIFFFFSIKLHLSTLFRSYNETVGKFFCTILALDKFDSISYAVVTTFVDVKENLDSLDWHN